MMLTVPHTIRDWTKGRRKGHAPYKAPPAMMARMGVTMMGRKLVGVCRSKGWGVRWEMNEWKGPAVSPLMVAISTEGCGGGEGKRG